MLFQVIAKPWILSPDTNTGDLTKLCNHKRKIMAMASLDCKPPDLEGKMRKGRINIFHAFKIYYFYHVAYLPTCRPFILYSLTKCAQRCQLKFQPFLINLLSECYRENGVSSSPQILVF